MKSFTVEELDRKEKATFVFFSGSSPKIGRHERALEDMSALKKFPNFRRELSNFHLTHIEDEAGRKYPSAEHMFHAEKSRMVKPKYAELFETGKLFGLLPPAKTIAKTGKNALDMGESMKDWINMKEEVLERIWRLKFIQNPALMEMLVATGDARLVHYAKQRGKSPVYEHWEELEALRDTFRF